ncbi:BLUF domain-containing protein [Polynucleobacter sp. HIN5]|uniref:BLUF domain-containing protein n=1 Tax=Polynucleobacter sp. HIN5 TaxID=3047864 RepID=UPI002573EC1D|nr:BLUF domain-containing protein [Polynucleobacter sp. HIN5]BEI33463.1 hypothetical protein PHIN5_08310 [Polynucleobacter sp. HIN5]
MPKPATKYFPEENYTELDLVSLSYVSDATEEFGILALMQLVDKASRRNKSLNITGVLSFDNGRFGQILEGKPKDVELLWEVIQRDPRHSNVVSLGMKRINSRRFANWSMRLCGQEEITSANPDLKL